MRKRKVLILGSRGMLGHMVFYFLQERNEYTLIDISFKLKLHNESFILDVRNDIELEKFIKSEKPDVIINCIGILIKGSQSNSSNAVYVNSYLPHRLADISRKYNSKLIHISTDCVFFGSKGNYSEADYPDAVDFYGRSKALGEIVNNKDITLRTSIIGPELKKSGEGLFGWFMQSKGHISGFTQSIWGGVTTLELAKVIEYVIQHDTTGLLNITNAKPISKYDLLSIIKLKFAKNDAEIDPQPGKVSNKSLISLREEFEYKVPSYEKMIDDLLIHMKRYSYLYEHYECLNKNEKL